MHPCTHALRMLSRVLGNQGDKDRCFPLLRAAASSSPRLWAGRQPSHPEIRPVADTCSVQTPWRLELMGLVSGALRSNAHLWPQRREGIGKLLTQRLRRLGLRPEPLEPQSTNKTLFGRQTGRILRQKETKSLTQENQTLCGGAKPFKTWLEHSWVGQFIKKQTI